MTARDSILILNSSFLLFDNLQFTIQPFCNMDLIVR